MLSLGHGLLVHIYLIVGFKRQYYQLEAFGSCAHLQQTLGVEVELEYLLIVEELLVGLLLDWSSSNLFLFLSTRRKPTEPHNSDLYHVVEAIFESLLMSASTSLR